MALVVPHRELKGLDELYDLEADPFGESNIIDRPDARDALDQMRSELRRLLEQTGFDAAPKAP